METTRWTIRGITTETADAVREVAADTGSSLGEVVTLCIRIALHEARRQLKDEFTGKSDLDKLLQLINQIADGPRNIPSRDPL